MTAEAIKIRAYTVEQANNLIQFETAANAVTEIGRRRDYLEHGENIVIFDPSVDRSLIVDHQVALVVVGAYIGLFRSLLAQDMEGEVQEIIQEKKEFIDGDDRKNTY